MQAPFLASLGMILICLLRLVPYTQHSDPIWPDTHWGVSWCEALQAVGWETPCDTEAVPLLLTTSQDAGGSCQSSSTDVSALQRRDVMPDPDREITPLMSSLYGREWRLALPFLKAVGWLSGMKHCSVFEPRAAPIVTVGGGEQSNSWAARAGAAPLPPESYCAAHVRQWDVPTTQEWWVHTRTAADTGTGIGAWSKRQIRTLYLEDRLLKALSCPVAWCPLLLPCVLSGLSRALVLCQWELPAVLASKTSHQLVL